MSKVIKVAPSILSADFGRLKDELAKCGAAGADIIHLDIMDGHFVPNLTFGPVVVEAIRRYTRLPLEAHLMIEHPSRYLEAFIRAGADIITVHAECYSTGPVSTDDSSLPIQIRQTNKVDIAKLQRDLGIIKSSDARPGLALNPGTPICMESILPEVDMVLVMTVNPGFAGQKFMESVLPKIKQLRGMYQGEIAVDGGITDKTAPLARAAGADILVTASYFFSAPDPKRALASLRG